MDFFDLESFRNSYFVKVIFVFSYYNYLGVIFLNYIYCDCFFLQILFGEYVCPTTFFFLTASCLISLLGSLRILLHITL